VREGLIYVVTNTITGDQYVGLTTKTLAQRWREHKTNARRKGSTYFYSAIRKYGEEVFEPKEVCSVFDKQMLSSIERAVIQDLKPKYNQTNGGEVTFGRKYDDETKERIRQGSLGKKRTPEQLERNRQITLSRWENNPEYREKALAAIKKAGAAIDREKQRKAVSIAAKNRVWSEKSRVKLSASCIGRVYGPEVIAKMRRTKQKAVQCNETGEIFSCRTEASEKTGVSARTVFRDVSGEKRKASKNRLTFSYIGK